MLCKELWIKDGRIVDRPINSAGVEYSDKVILDQFGLVRVVYNASGTTVQWNMSCRNWSSLMLLATLLSALNAPYTFKYFNAGWFTETHTSIHLASERIESLIFKSDVRLSVRAYTSVVIPNLDIIPERLHRALKTGEAPDSLSVVCAVEPDREYCHVEHVGQETVIGRIWGVSPNSFPCLTGHSYDKAVTPEYFKVAESGRPHYDHVLASMIRPDGERHWYGYHRVILPDLVSGPKRVRVLSELAPVDIHLL